MTHTYIELRRTRNVVTLDVRLGRRLVTRAYAENKDASRLVLALNRWVRHIKMQRKNKVFA